MTKEEFILSGLLEQYALGVTTTEESLSVKEFLTQFPDLREELNFMEEALETYCMEHAQVPTGHVKEKLMNRIFPAENNIKHSLSKTVQMDSAKRPVSFYKIATAAMLVLLIGSVAFAYYFYVQNKNAQNQLANARQSIEQQQQINESLTGNLDIITDKYAQSVVLKGTPQAPDATAKIFWMKNTGQVYVDSRDLPAPPAGKQYQLWAIVDGAPVDAGMITTDQGSYTIQKMKSFGKVQAFAITLEKSGGSITPTMSEMVVISEL